MQNKRAEVLAKRTAARQSRAEAIGSDGWYANKRERPIRESKTLEAAIATREDRLRSSERFIALLDKYERFEPLTTTMSNEFVGKILVHERAPHGQRGNRAGG